jgi:hypothetical protein
MERLANAILEELNDEREILESEIHLRNLAYYATHAKLDADALCRSHLKPSPPDEAN